MKRFILIVVVFVFIGIAIHIPSVFAAGLVIFDGKSLFFPKNERIEPADISGLEFDLKLPEDKNFVVGNIYRAQFDNKTFSRTGQLRYCIFTKWTAERIEIFIWPPDFRYRAKPFLDCNISNSCDLRGTNWVNFRLIFRGGHQMALVASDGWEANLEIVGTIPVQFINEHSKKAD